MNQLIDILSYKREVLTQLLLVATIFGAFSMSGVVALLVAPERGRLRSFMFLTLCGASLAFIFATILDALILPAAGRMATQSKERAVVGMLNLGDVVIWAVVIGASALATAIASFGFEFSRRMGFVVLLISAVTLLALVASFWYLADVLS